MSKPAWCNVSEAVGAGGRKAQTKEIITVCFDQRMV